MEKGKEQEKSSLAKRPETLLSREEFRRLAEVPPELEWFANIRNANTRRAYRNDVREFSNFVGIRTPSDMRLVTRSHVIAWRNTLENLAAATIRRKMSALSSLFEFLCNANAVNFNPVKGVQRPSEGANEGKTDAISDAQARALLQAPDVRTLKGKRDFAILSCYLFHGFRVSELVALNVGSLRERRGVKHFEIHGKRSKIRFVPAHPGAIGAIDAYLEEAGHGENEEEALFCSIWKSAKQRHDRERPKSGRLDQRSVYTLLKKYAMSAGVDLTRCNHAMRATAATNALEHEADIAKVQEWLGHSNIATTRLYDRREMKPEDSPTFKVRY